MGRSIGLQIGMRIDKRAGIIVITEPMGMAGELGYGTNDDGIGGPM